MKRKTLRIKMTSLLIGVTASIFILCSVANSLCSGYFYLLQESKKLEKTYHSINSIFNYNEEDFDFLSEQLVTNSNLKVLVVEPVSIMNGYDTYRIIFTNIMGHVEHYQDMIEFMQETLPNDFAKENFYIKINRDGRMKIDYLDLYGVLDNGNIIMLRSPIESIRTSARVSSKLMAEIGIIGILLGSLLVYMVTRKLIKPIEEMAVVAGRMAELDFDAKVVDLPDDEIGVLGETMNHMSEELEATIQELKTANNELLRDNEQKTKIDEMRKDFIAHVSHELKTPIALIQGYAEGLSDNINDDEESREFYCEVIRDEAEKMNRMVKKLLTLNQIEFGNMTVQMERFDVGEMVQNLLTSSKVLLEEKQVKLEYIQPETVEVWADEYMIEEVVSNYISNAIHHVSPGGAIRIWFEPKADCIRLFVYNQGNHIPEEELDKIWIKFYKVDKARTREYGGSGIGLSIVAATMQSHGRDYGVENVKNGVRFYIDLDLNKYVE